MIHPDDIQRYLRESAMERYLCEFLPGFTLCFHQTTDLPFFNYAIPEKALFDTWKDSLFEIKEIFIRYKRIPRLEFVKESFPELPDILLETGFEQEEEQQGMACFPHTFFASSASVKISFSEILHTSRDEEIKQFLLLQEEGFTSHPPEPKSPEEISYFRQTLKAGKGCVCLWQDLPVSVGMHTSPLGGITEILGVTTLKQYRRKGIASALISKIVKACFSQDIHTCYLTAADKEAGHIYRKLGFAPILTMLSYRLR